ncbi:MAG: HAD-IC family P-type ATPase [Lactobacillus sp.]|nr:HAD-IC family P-type ATPase [Lactobacillus sp.]
MAEKYQGLSSSEAEQRLKDNGYNEVPEPSYNFWKAFFGKLWNLSAWILEAALIVECLLGKWVQSLFVLLMLLFAAYNGATQKKKSQKVLNKISHKLTPLAKVMRDGNWQKIAAKFLVVDDLVSLQKGDVLAADVEVLSGELSFDESSITGESEAVKKQIGDTAFAGTTVVNGFGLAKVTAVGKDSRSGKTINLINKSAAPGHLQELLTKLIFYLCVLDGILTVFIIIGALVKGEGLHGIIQMLPFLAMMFIASIPVAMPSTFALSNSFEATDLSKKGILTADLTGIQDAANLNLLLLDKTGTITENKTSVVEWHNYSALADKEILALLSSAVDRQNESIIDRALLDLLTEEKITLPEFSSFVPFSSDTGYSQAECQNHNIKLGSFKQLALIDPEAENVAKELDFSKGRSVALLVDDHLAAVFLLKDRIRSDSKAILSELQERGIKTIMLTGDNRRTAEAVAREVNLNGDIIAISDLTDSTDLQKISGIAEVLPEDKLRIVRLFQEKGFIVGMTGDGVNDAPALKQAEVGIAVSSAVDVAKRSSKMVLLEDGLSGILHILDSGHRVYQRMTTWSLTKLSRTAELTMLITFGYLFYNFIPLALNAMVIYTIMNNMVTMMIGTDRVTITKQPENWDMLKLAKIAFSLAFGWLVVGVLFVSVLLHQGFDHNSIATMTYIFLVTSAMLLVLITRTKGYFWMDYPSKFVGSVQIIDMILTILLATFGIAMAQIDFKLVLLSLAVSLVGAIIIDLIYSPVIKKVK